MDKEKFSSFCKTMIDFVDNTLIPAEEEVEEKDCIPESIIQEMKNLGLFGSTIPEEYGGLGLTLSQQTALMLILGKTSPAFQAFPGTNQGIGSKALLLEGESSLKQKYLPLIANGDIITSFALTEPEAGSDAFSIKTEAIKRGSKWILNGHKCFITNAPEAHLFNIVAKVKNQKNGHKGAIFLVTRDNPGLKIGEKDHKMGHRGSHTAEIILNNCEIEENMTIGKIGTGFKTVINVLVNGRVQIAALAVGMAKRLLEESAHSARTRKQFGKAIGEFQFIKEMLSSSRAEIFAAESMVEKTAELFERGESIKIESSCCKLFATEVLGRVADRCVQLHGGRGYIKGNVIERFYRDSRLLRIYEGTNEIQKNIIANALTHIL